MVVISSELVQYIISCLIWKYAYQIRYVLKCDWKEHWKCWRMVVIWANLAENWQNYHIWKRKNILDPDQNIWKPPITYRKHIRNIQEAITNEKEFILILFYFFLWIFSNAKHIFMQKTYVETYRKHTEKETQSQNKFIPFFLIFLDLIKGKTYFYAENIWENIQKTKP